LNTGKGIRFPADDIERRKWMDPDTILSGIGLKAGLTFLDIGCGGGFFALPAARIVGPGGRVYGLDPDARAIAVLKAQAAREKLENLHLTVGRGEETVLCDKCADIVFFGIDLHDFQDPAMVLENARKMIKPSGRLVNLDWKKVDMRFGPPLEKRFNEHEAGTLIEAAGFSIESVAYSGPYHYLITAKLKVSKAN